MIVLFGFAAFAWVAEGSALKDEDVRVVEQAVHGGAGEERIAKQLAHLRCGSIRGDQGGVSFVAGTDDLVQVHGLIVAQRPVMAGAEESV